MFYSYILLGYLHRNVLNCFPKTLLRMIELTSGFCGIGGYGTLGSLCNVLLCVALVVKGLLLVRILIHLHCG